MLRLALLFLIMALIAGMLHLGGIASAFADIAWVLIVVFLVLAALSFVLSFNWRTGPPV